MLASERQRLIKEHALIYGQVSIPEIAQKFNVSVETIRRDINILCQKNILKKVHGGAVPVQVPVREDAYDIRYYKNQREKSVIAEYIASNMIDDNDSIAISSGSTMEILAGSISKRNLVIVTNSINVASILQKRIRQNIMSGEVIILGGTIHPDEHYTSGVFALEMLKKFSFTKAFLGASAVSDRDLMTSNIDEGVIMTAMINHSKFCCVAADSSKFDVRSTYKYADIAEIDAIVTEESDRISEEILMTFKSANVAFHKAPIT